MLNVKKIMEKWGRFDKIVRISGVKWRITFKNRLFLGTSEELTCVEDFGEIKKRVLTKTIQRTILGT